MPGAKKGDAVAARRVTAVVAISSCDDVAGVMDSLEPQRRTKITEKREKKRRRVSVSYRCTPTRIVI